MSRLLVALERSARLWTKRLTVKLVSKRAFFKETSPMLVTPMNGPLPWSHRRGELAGKQAPSSPPGRKPDTYAHVCGGLPFSVASDRARTHIQCLQSREEQYAVDRAAYFLNRTNVEAMRKSAIERLEFVLADDMRDRICEEVVDLAVFLLDAWITRKHILKRSKGFTNAEELGVLLVVLTNMAVKFHMRHSYAYSDQSKTGLPFVCRVEHLPKERFIELEAEILDLTQWHLNPPLVSFLLDQMCAAVGMTDADHCEWCTRLWARARSLFQLLAFRPSVVAAAVLRLYVTEEHHDAPCAHKPFGPDFRGGDAMHHLILVPAAESDAALAVLHVHRADRELRTEAQMSVRAFDREAAKERALQLEQHKRKAESSAVATPETEHVVPAKRVKG